MKVICISEWGGGIVGAGTKFFLESFANSEIEKSCMEGKDGLRMKYHTHGIRAKIMKYKVPNNS